MRSHTGSTIRPLAPARLRSSRRCQLSAPWHSACSASSSAPSTCITVGASASGSSGNSDGSTAEMCGNGARCFARYIQRAIPGTNGGTSNPTMGMLDDSATVPGPVASSGRPRLARRWSGRTGRATRTGEALTFVTTGDFENVRLLERKLGTRIERQSFEGFEASHADQLERLTNQLVNRAESDIATLVANTDAAYQDSRRFFIAVAAGKHIMVEKPLELSLERADQLLAAAKAQGVQVAAIFNRRFIPASIAKVMTAFLAFELPGRRALVPAAPNSSRSPIRKKSRPARLGRPAIGSPTVSEPGTLPSR